MGPREDTEDKTNSCFDFREGWKVAACGEGGQVYAHVLCPPGPKSYLDRPFHVGCLSSPSTVWNCMVKPAPFWGPVRRPLHLLQYVMSRNLNFLSKKVILGPHLPSFPFISSSFRPQVALFWGPLGAVWGYNEGERRAEAEHARPLILGCGDWFLACRSMTYRRVCVF